MTHIYLFLKNKLSDTFNKKEKEKVYVIGNGWSSYYFVKYLNKNKFEPIIIAPNLKVLNTPKLINLIFDKNANVEFNNPYAQIIPDTLQNIDLENNILITNSGNKYNYKNLVLSIGSEPNDFNIKGVERNTLKFKTIQDALTIREKLLLKKINNIYIIGTGVTGIELGSKLGKIYNIHMIDGLKKILPGFNENTQDFIFNWITKNQKNININLNSLVKSIDNNNIYFNSNYQLKSFSYNKNDLVIWTGGVKFNGYGKTELYKTLSTITEINTRGLKVEQDFRINNNIFCIGDMVGNQGPPTAQNAKLQGLWLAEYFNNNFDSNYIKNNKFESKTQLKLIHLNDKTYLESEYYNGFILKIYNKIINWFN